MDATWEHTVEWNVSDTKRHTQQVPTCLWKPLSEPLEEWNSGHGGGEPCRKGGAFRVLRRRQKRKLYSPYWYTVIIRTITFKDPNGACDQSWHAFQWIRTMSASSVLSTPPAKAFMPCSASGMSVMTMLAALLSVMLQLTKKLWLEIMLVWFLNLLQSEVLFYKVFFTRLI